jgi:HSP20 family protein
VAVLKHNSGAALPARTVDPVDPFFAFDRMFGLWPLVRPFRFPTLATRRWIADEFIRVDQYQEDGVLVVKAELPGIDPDKDVNLTVSDGMLRISAERHEEDHKEGTDYVRREMRYGSFTRVLPLPEGASESDIKASYKDGILEIRVPTPKPVPETKIPITIG